MKPSNYNYIFDISEPDTENEFLVYNAMSNGLAVVDENLVELLRDPQNFDVEDPDLVENLKRGGFLLKQHDDEITLLKTRQRMNQFAVPNLVLTIAPTINCNLACPYCFENHIKGKMTRSVMEGIVTFIGNQINGGMKKITNTWYGGEPLLYPDVIEKLSEDILALCEATDVAYEASIITNGTKYTPEVAHMLKRAGVNEVQITLDGSEQIHNTRRYYRGGQGSFQKILTNLEATAGIIPVVIRINLDKQNYTEGIKALEEITAQPWFNPKHFGFYFGWVRNYTEHVEGGKAINLTPEEFHGAQEKLMKLMGEIGCAQNNYPSPYGGCVATTVNGYVIGPRGRIWKCWSNLGDADKVVGNIFDGVHFTPAYMEYLHQTWETDPECLACKALPICMGGCTDVRLNRDEGKIDHKDCGTWRYNIESKLRAYHTKTYRSQKAGELPFAVPMEV